MSPPHRSSNHDSSPAGPCDANFETRFTYMETIVGKTPEEGLRKDFADMKKILHAMELRIYAAMGAISAVIWLIERSGSSK